MDAAIQIPVLLKPCLCTCKTSQTTKTLFVFKRNLCYMIVNVVIYASVQSTLFLEEVFKFTPKPGVHWLLVLLGTRIDTRYRQEEHK